MVIEAQKRRYIVTELTELDEYNNKNNKRTKKMNKKIIDLNDHCLEKILFYLSVKDLGNISRSNTRFINSAKYVFKKLHVNTLIIFDPCTSNSRKFNTFLNILDGLGDNITKLHVTFYHEERYRKRNQQILHRIGEKGSKNIRDLTLSNFQHDMIISKPFLHLRKLTMNDSYFSESMAQFIQKSPNISHLEFNSVKNVFNSKFVEQQIPLMEHFANYNEIIVDSEVENLQKFRRFVNVNQQLTSLGIGNMELEMMLRYDEIRQQFFKTIHRKLPYPDQSNSITYLLPFEPLYFGNMQHLSLSLGYSTDFLHCLRQRRILIKHLPVEQLELYVGHLNIETIDFLIHCRDLRKLRLNVCEELDLTNFISIVFNLQKLEEIEVYLLYDENPELSLIPAAFNQIIKHCQQIKRIVVGYEIRKPSSSKHSKDKENIVTHYQSILSDEFSLHLPNFWTVDFVVQNIEIKQRQNSRDPLFFCSILNQQLQ